MLLDAIAWMVVSVVGFLVIAGLREAWREWKELGEDKKDNPPNE
jgi:hypothetical protein